MFKLRIGHIMGFCIHFATRKGQRSEAGGPNFPPDGLDWITTVFLCSLWNFKRCSSKLRRDTSGHIVQPQFRKTLLPGRWLWVTVQDWKWKTPLRYRVLCRWLHLSCYTYITGIIKACGKCVHEWYSWRLPSICGWWVGIHIAEEDQKTGGTMELGKGGVGFSIW